MLTVDENITTTAGRDGRHEGVQPSRRGLLTGAAAALGATGLPVAARAAPGADADIIETCDRFVAAELEWRRLVYAGDEAGADALADGERGEAMDAVAELPLATTPTGLRAKAAAIVAFWHPDPPPDGAFDGAVWEVLTALAGPEVLAQLQQQQGELAGAQS